MIHAFDERGLAEAAAQKGSPIVVQVAVRVTAALHLDHRPDATFR